MRNIVDDLKTVLNTVEEGVASDFKAMIDSFPKDDSTANELGEAFSLKQESLNMYDDEFNLLMIYHLGLLHGGNNVKT